MLKFYVSYMFLARTSYWTNGRVSCDMRLHDAHGTSLLCYVALSINVLLFQASGDVIGVAVDGLVILAPDDVTDTTSHGSHCDSRHADGSVAYVAVADRFPYIMACNGSHNCGKCRYCLSVGTRTGLTESSLVITLQWLHNERDGDPDHWRLNGLLERLLGVDQRKHQSSASLAFVRGIHRWPMNSPHKGAVTRKMFSFDDVSWHC